MKTVCIAGGGPAGLAAAVHAARAGAAVTLLERNDRCGVKLTITGGGRCNVTNLRPADEWPALFGRHGRFIVPALRRLPAERLLAWLAELGQPCECTDGIHYFPVSASAKAVRDALVREAERSGVRIRCGARVSGLEPTGSGWTVRAGEETFSCHAVILAAGGNSYQATGSSWDGCRIAAGLGHTVQAPAPGLAGLKCTNIPAELAGIVLPDAAAALKSAGRPAVTGRGELLFTHGGVSGPAVLDLSASVSRLLAQGGNMTLRLRWQAEKDEAVWCGLLNAWRQRDGGTPLAALLRQHLPQRLARWLCAEADIGPDVTAAALTAGGRDRLTAALGGFPAAVTGTEGWERAMITRGGVSVREIDPHTLESTLLPGLFFAGEMIDTDGPCGGYNLHWALAGGTLAGENAGRS